MYKVSLGTSEPIWFNEIVFLSFNCDAYTCDIPT